jgi:hypothetical protein
MQAARPGATLGEPGRLVDPPCESRWTVPLNGRCPVPPISLGAALADASRVILI